MTKVSFIILLIFSFTSAYSQPCLTEGIIFSTQAQIDSFQINYPNCTEIEGIVQIEGDDIINLLGLNVLRTVGDNLEIMNNPLLTNLEGLEHLSMIYGDLEVGGNNNLINLLGLNILQSVLGNISIYHNNSLSNLNGLEGLTHINGDFLIGNNGMLADFYGLHHVTSVGGNLTIEDNDELSNFAGLEELSEIGNDFNITGNANLINLVGVDNLDIIGGSLEIRYADMLTNLSGLENLNHVGDDIYFLWNSSLINLEGLGGLTYLGYALGLISNHALNSLSGMTMLTDIDKLNLVGNDALIDLTGLEDISSIRFINIHANDGLTSLTGIDNIDPNNIAWITICNNDLLSTCEVQSICDYLANPGGDVSIFNNAPGCNNPPEVADACGFTMPCLPFGDYYFLNQSEVDHFQSNYPGCTALEGNVNIGGYDITNLDSLEVVTSINGSLRVGGCWGCNDNRRLKNLSGLEGLTSIGGSLYISKNDSLLSLEGLNNLEYLGGDLMIGYNWGGLHYINPQLMDISSLRGLTSIGKRLHIYGNDDLTKLDGLNNIVSVGDHLYITNNPVLSTLDGLSSLTSIDGLLRIDENDTLESLSGLDNIEASSISELYISNNNLLTTCEVASICNYLCILQGYAEISNNATGCESIEEVQDSCIANAASLDEEFNNDNIFLFPNPAREEVNITLKGYEIDQVNIYTLTGQKVLHERPIEGSINISHLQPGMYIVEVTIEKTRLRQKLLVQR